MFLRTRGRFGKGEGEALFKLSSMTIVGSPQRFSMFSTGSPFSLVAFRYEPFVQAGIHSSTSRSRVVRRNTTPRSGCRGMANVYPLCRDKKYALAATQRTHVRFNPVRGSNSSEHTTKAKGGCHWGACLPDGTYAGKQPMHRVRLTSGMQPDEGIAYT